MPDRSGGSMDGKINLVSPGAYAVSDASGDIGPSGGGLFYRDTRHLSWFALKINGARPVSLGCKAEGPSVEFSLTLSADKGSEVQVSRRRTLGEGMIEEILLSNGSREAVEASVSLEFAADFRDVFEVRGYRRASERGQLEREVGKDRLKYVYRRGEFRRGTTVRVSGEGMDTLFGLDLVSLNVSLEPGETRRVRVFIVLEDEKGEVSWGRIEPKLYQGASGMKTSHETLQACWKRSVEDLESLSFDAGGGLLVPAAGSPWYMALFGRDSLITGYQTMLLGPEPAKNTLRALARHQAARRDDFTDAEPGKILHELRRGELAHFGEIPHSPYYGSVDATPLFLILLNEVWRWTGDAEFVQEMESPARRALDWILRHSDQNGDGYADYESRSSMGLQNLSWKDSANSMLFRDGTRAEGPISPSEVQGYIYDAFLRTAEIARRIWRDEPTAAGLRERAENLKARFNRDFWMEERGYYALALDGAGRQVDSVTSNAGHLLWSGIVPEDRARAVVDRLMDEDLFSGWGVRTMAAGEGGYNPDSYHNGSVWPHDNALIAMGLRRYGFREEAARAARAILEAAACFDYRLPEVFAGHPRHAGVAPVSYPTSCSPQAWAAGATLLLVRAVLGLDAERRDLRQEILVPESLFRGVRGPAS